MIGKLRAILGLDTKQFERGMSGAGSRVRLFSRETAVMAAKVSAAMSAGLAAVAGLTTSTIGAAHEIDRLSQVANTSPETFQRWGAGASMVGIEQEKLADILKDVNDRVGDFLSTGGGPMKDFFENIAPKVGVTADQFRRLSGPEALQLYVDSLQKAGASQQQMTFYLEAMASDATLLLPLLRDGGAEMERLGNKAESLGAVLSGSSIAAMRETRAAMAEIGLAAQGIRNQIAEAALPAVQAFAKGLSSATSEGGALNKAVKLIFGNLDRLATYVATAAAGFGTYLVAGLAASAVAAVRTAGAMTLLRAAIIRTGIGALIVGAGEVVLWFSRLSEGAGGFGNSLKLLGELAAGVWTYIKSSAASILPALKAIWVDLHADFLDMVGALQWTWYQFMLDISHAAFAVGLDDIARRFGDASESVAEGLDATTEKVAGLRGEAEGLRAASEGLRRDGWDAVKEAAGALVEAVKGAGAVTSDTKASMNALNDALNTLPGTAGAASGAANNLKDSLTGVQKQAKRIEDSFGQAFKSFVTGASSAREAAASLLSSLASIAAESAWKSLVGGTSGGGGLFGFLGNLLPNANGNAFSAGRVTPFARGGVVSSPTLFPMRNGTGLMGEAGPEAIMPLTRTADGKLGVRAAGAGGAQQVIMRVELDNEVLKARIEEEAGLVAVQVVNHFSRTALPGRVQQISRDPRKKN
jgi:lambda family phage tail tape measure protein